LTGLYRLAVSSLMLITVHVASEHIETKTVLHLIATPIIQIFKFLTHTDIHPTSDSSHASFEEIYVLTGNVNYFTVGVKRFMVILAKVGSADS